MLLLPHSGCRRRCCRRRCCRRRCCRRRCCRRRCCCLSRFATRRPPLPSAGSAARGGAGCHRAVPRRRHPSDHGHWWAAGRGGRACTPGWLHRLGLWLTGLRTACCLCGYCRFGQDGQDGHACAIHSTCLHVAWRRLLAALPSPAPPTSAKDVRWTFAAGVHMPYLLHFMCGLPLVAAGDNKSTAESVGRQVGLLQGGQLSSPGPGSDVPGSSSPSLSGGWAGWVASWVGSGRKLAHGWGSVYAPAGTKCDQQMRVNKCFALHPPPLPLSCFYRRRGV